MSRKVMSKQELLDNREALLEQYHQSHRKSASKPILTKKERKVLGIGKDQGKAVLRNIRMSPHKVGYVCNLVRGKDLSEAKAMLTYLNKAAANDVLKVLKSAEANAVNNNSLDAGSLYVADLQVGSGPIMKRWRAAGKGSGRAINKRTCQITAVVKERA